MKKQMVEWCKQEFKDSEKILTMNKSELIFEIWNSRSNKTIIFVIGIFVGLGIAYISGI